MEFDQTNPATPVADPGPEGELEGMRGGPQLDGLDEKQRRAEIAARLFGTPLEPVRVDRYAVLRKLGAGGMGIVYVAYDERLDRRVAIKLLRHEAASSEATVRLQREAQAMARLAHPNVVAVYETGIHAEQVFVVMELVEGCDLREWLAAQPRSWRAVLEQFRQAGEGLATAHAANIVHRDFKPDNVLVGDDGRTRVADFGLAFGLGMSSSTEQDSDSNNKLEVSLTRTGALAGTPAYMSPEQYRRRPADERSDQFSFCIALWEGLYGQRPFVGSSLSSLARAMCAGDVREPEDRRGVPAWLHATLLRGLAVEPDARWPSMRALLDALDADPRQRWRRVGLVLAAAGGCAALVLVASVALREIGENIRQRYYNVLTEELLEIERDRGLRQARDDAARARDATRMSVVRSHEPSSATHARERDDPTVVASLLREVEGELRGGSAWLSSANRVLGRPLSQAVLRGQRGEISALVYAPDRSWLYAASTEGEVWRWPPEGGAGERILAHEGEITRLVLSADGRWLASGSVDGSVRLWSTQDERARTLVRHAEPVRALAFAPRGHSVAVGLEDGSIFLQPVAGGAGQRLATQAGIVLALDFDASGEWLLSGSTDRQARLWKVEERGQQPVALLAGHTKAIYFVELSSPTRALTASDDGSVRVWTPAGESELWLGQVLATHADAVAAMDVYGDQVVTGSLDGTLRVSALVPPFASVSLPRHADQVWGVAFIDEGRRVVSTSFDHSARITPADGRGEPIELLGHRAPVYSLGLDASGMTLATGAYDSEVRIWDLRRPQLTTALRGHDDVVFTVELDAAGERAVTASHDGSARVWGLSQGATLAVLGAATPESSSISELQRAINHAVLSPDGERVATARNDGEVSLWDVASESEDAQLGKVGSRAWRVAFGLRGQRVAAGSTSGDVRVWDAGSGALVLELAGHQQYVTGLAFEPGSGNLVTAAWDGKLALWEASSGAQLAAMRAHEGRILGLVPSPDGHTWATVGSDGAVGLWPNLRGQPQLLRGHEQPVWSAAFDESGARLVTGGYDGRALVWSVEEGQLLEALEGHGAKVWGVAFLGEQRVLTAAGDGALRLWSLGTGQAPLVFSEHTADIQGIAVGLGGRRVITASADRSARLWRVDQISDDADELLARLWQATSSCLPVEQRQRELGETREMARDAAQACEQRIAAKLE